MSGKTAAGPPGSDQRCPRMIRGRRMKSDKTQHLNHRLNYTLIHIRRILSLTYCHAMWLWVQLDSLEFRTIAPDYRYLRCAYVTRVPLVGLYLQRTGAGLLVYGPAGKALYHPILFPRCTLTIATTWIPVSCRNCTRIHFVLMIFG